MKLPHNFSEGEIPDLTFRQAFDAAFEKKSRFTIIQILTSEDVSKSVAEKYADQIISAAMKRRESSRLPHLIIGWAILLIGVAISVFTFLEGSMTIFAIGPIGFGIFWILYNRK